MLRLAHFLIGSLSLIISTTAQSTELKVFSSRAVWTVLRELSSEIERDTGVKLILVTGLSSEFIKRIHAGEPFDVVAAPPPVLDELIRNDKVSPSSKMNLVRSEVGVLVQAGAPKPDVRSVEAFKQALLTARSITYLPVPGVPQMLEKLGLKEALAPKVIVPESEISAELVARGEAEIGILVITQAFTTPGVELAGPLPKELQRYSVFGGAVSSTSKAPDAARRVLKYLKSPRALEVIKAQGMEAL